MKHTLYCVAKAIETAHKAKILHRNIGVDQVLCAQGGLIKLTGFTYSKQLTTDKNYAHGYKGECKHRDGKLKSKYTITPDLRCSPEQANGESYSFPHDIYSFGTLMCEMVNHGRPPYARAQPYSNRKELR